MTKWAGMTECAEITGCGKNDELLDDGLHNMVEVSSFVPVCGTCSHVPLHPADVDICRTQISLTAC